MCSMYGPRSPCFTNRSVSWACVFDNGETFDSSEGRAPLAFEVGGGMVIKGFDEGVAGMTVGEKKTVNIPFDEAYGPRNPEMLVEFPREKFPTDMELEVGMPLMMNNGADQQFQVVVTEIKDDITETIPTVTIDSATSP